MRGAPGQHRGGRHRDGEFVEASFKQGKLKKESKGKNPKEPDGTFIEFEPDPEIFKESEYRAEHVERRLRHYSYLNTGLRLILNWKGPVAQTSKSAVSRVSKPADRPTSHAPPIWKSATQQVWKPALRAALKFFSRATA